MKQRVNSDLRIDFHTHILPQVDDGSQSIEESLQMIKALRASGVGCIVLTPHFYAQRDNPEQFLERRDNAFAKLKAAVLKDPDISDIHLIPGAEIEYFAGITCMSDYPGLKLGKTPCLLVEMPHGTWTSRMIDDLLQLNNQSNCRVVIAHVERYLFEQKKDIIHILLENGIIMQSNTSFFLDRRSVRLAVKMLKKGFIHLLGSDCHGMTVRPPNIGEACEVITKRLGEDVLDDMMLEAYDLLYTDIHSSDGTAAVKVGI